MWLLNAVLWMVGFYGGLGTLVVLTSATAYRTAKGRKWSPTADAVVHAVCLAALLGIALALDDFGGASASWTYCGGVLAFGLLPSAATVRTWRSRAALVTTLAFVASVATMHFADLTPKKPYQRFFDAVHVGMTRDDVFAALRHEFPDDGRYRVPTLGIDRPDLMNFNLDLHDGRYDAECVTLTLVGGMVASKLYDMD